MASSHDRRASTSDGYHSRPSHHRRHHRSREHSPDSSRLRPEPRPYSTRQGASPAPPSRSRAPSPLPPNPPLPTRVRKPWPPAPVAEDEKVSLARESNASITGSDISDTPSRGSVDQQPILLEVESANDSSSSCSSSLPAGTSKQRERRPYRSEYQNSRRTDPSDRSEQSHSGLEVPETPIFTRRAPSPYRFTPKAANTSQVSSTDSGYFSDKKYPPASGIEAITSEALRGRGNPSPDGPTSLNVDAAVSDDEPNVQHPAERKSTPYSFVSSSAQEKSQRPAPRDFAKADAPQRLAEIKAEAIETPRRSSDSASNMSRPTFDNKKPSPNPLNTSTAAQSAAFYAAASSQLRSSGSRPASPVEMPSAFPPSPPRSPRNSSYYSKESPHSARSSVSGSVSGSRPSSPVSAQTASMPQEGIRRSSTFPVILDDRSQRTSRLSSSAHVDDLNYPVSPVRSPSSALPYPADDMNIMPSEEDQRYRPRPLGEDFPPRPAGYPPRPTTRDGPPQSPVSSRPTSLEVPSRPGVQTRHSLDTNLPILATAMAASLTPLVKEPETPIIDRPSETGLHRPRARCFQTQSGRSYDGWFVLNGCPSFEICPSCFDKHMAQTIFSNSFKQVYRREPNPNVYCSFDTPWIKIAWKITQQQQRPDLNLMYAVVQASESEPRCPGKNRESRAWHTVYGEKGDYVHGFDICPCDVKKIEALMPSLRGVFQQSSTSGRKRRCNLRTDSTRFEEYLYMLMDLDATATRTGRSSDMTEFLELARLKAQMRECSRDELIVDQGWHFAPQLPEFTVCEECYSAVVWPAIADNSSVAGKFKRTPELVDEDKELNIGSSSRRTPTTLPGTSCQLYSDRMRQVFLAAVEKDDFHYLVRRARARKEMEVELHAEFASISAELKDVEKSLAKSGDRQMMETHPARVKLLNEIGKISEDWRKWE